MWSGSFDPQLYELISIFGSGSQLEPEMQVSLHGFWKLAAED
jgi:hypothetical protein